ncbi:hypothetical protein N3K66_003186 [Trichothecium roseum]|uniref:Uncharacterized protein n=1 Tax=Trichothecium roseum TaxID=47278 RepID=A0ACC0V6M5_9HYPO|nr:hypothetical protein N3K66_003186 [Trichothecium roseum]
MASNNEPRRRFAPVPIETTFQSVRKPGAPNSSQNRHGMGPSAELTPDASPRSPSPMPRVFQERRRFAPQLIETSRRTRRAGDAGPTTRPTDKTDITPYTKNIYTTTSKPRGRRRNSSIDEPTLHIPPTRRETEEEGVKEYLLELAAKAAERQIQETALAAFPNSRPREGGIAHFYFRESSSSDESPEATPATEPHEKPRTRRKSSNLGLNWWHKHMQDHAEHLAHERGEDEMDEDVIVDEDKEFIMRSDSELDQMELPAPPDALWTTTNKVVAENVRDAVARGPVFDDRTPSPDEVMHDISAIPSKPVEKIVPDAGFGSFGKPFGGFPPLKTDPQQARKGVSPPMLGKDLTFRECPSPKFTKLETDHSFFQQQAELLARDTTGNGGLWGGYCFKSDPNADDGPYNYAPRMIETPKHTRTPEEADVDSHISDEPSSIFSSADLANTNPTAERRPNGDNVGGVHMLHGLGERLQKEKSTSERYEKIAQEFNDEFVTQVYNYLSLGYPATANHFDEELAKISGVCVAELRRDDAKQMAKGHMLEMSLEDEPEDARCPRWKALKTYVTEWARQHPDLDNLDPMAWGVRERRGSWAF